jgi:hypothetical protein
VIPNSTGSGTRSSSSAAWARGTISRPTPSRPQPTGSGPLRRITPRWEPWASAGPRWSGSS